MNAKQVLFYTLHYQLQGNTIVVSYFFNIFYKKKYISSKTLSLIDMMYIHVFIVKCSSYIRLCKR